MLSEKFRYQLRQEAEQWRTEGLIDDSVYEQLSKRYQFNDIEVAASNRFVVILLGLGTVLLGLGILAFVAANWQGWSRELKVTLLLSGFVGINTTGFYLWRHPTHGWQRRLGQGLLLLGALTLGANMALMSQLFHQSGLAYQLYLVWGLGVLAMAYSLRLTMLGLLAALLIGLGYLQGQPEFVAEFVAIKEFSWLQLLLQHMPVLAGLMFIPLAYLCRSRWIFRIGAFLVVFSLETNLIRLNVLGYSPWLAAIACALPPALLWAYSDFPWGKRPPTADSFNRIARTLAITFLSLLFYLLSFYGLWSPSLGQTSKDVAVLPLPLLVNISILGSLAIWQWLRLLRRWDLTNSFMAILIAITALVPYWHLSSGGVQSAIAAALFFNLLLFFLGIGLIRKGLSQSQRRLFWGGIVLLTLQIFSRMFEYNTDLLFKSLVLFVYGFGVIGAGLWFERYVRAGDKGRTL